MPYLDKAHHQIFIGWKNKHHLPSFTSFKQISRLQSPYHQYFAVMVHLTISAMSAARLQ